MNKKIHRVLVIENQCIDVNKLSRQILKNEPKIIKKYPPTGADGVYTDGNTGLGSNSLTSRFYHFNVLKWWGTKVLRKEIRRGYEIYSGVKNKPLYVQCWANVMRKGEQIRSHIHCPDAVLPQHALSGHLNVQVDEVCSTYYDDEALLNKNRQLVIFPIHLPHHTDQYMGDGERITVAFDIFSEEFFKYDVSKDAQKHWIRI